MCLEIIFLWRLELLGRLQLMGRPLVSSPMASLEAPVASAFLVESTRLLRRN
jgi:hypothetical protein